MMPVAGAERSGSGSDCSDCSLCARRGRSDSGGVRVSVDLSQFFSDHRARVLMWAPHGRCVRWLARRVACAHGLPAVALLSRGHLLPAAEPLRLLDQDDAIQVVDASYAFTGDDRSNETSSQRVNNGNNITALTCRVPTDQCNENNEQTSTSLISSPQNTPEDYQSGYEVSIAEDVEATTESLERQSVDEDEELQRLKRRALRLLDEHEEAAPKRLRRRRRRRRPAGLHDDEPQPGATTAAPQQEAAVAPPHDAGAVLRNGPGSRPPRLVHALSTSPLDAS